MRKFFAMMLALAMMLSVGAVSASAHGSHHGALTQTGSTQPAAGVSSRENEACNIHNAGACFVDINGDGICDNSVHCTGGICKGQGAACYADENGDGVCDNCTDGSSRICNPQYACSAKTNAAGGCDRAEASHHWDRGCNQ